MPSSHFPDLTLVSLPISFIPTFSYLNFRILAAKSIPTKTHFHLPRRNLQYQSQATLDTQLVKDEFWLLHLIGTQAFGARIFWNN
jgi:hypothetical protein